MTMEWGEVEPVLRATYRVLGGQDHTSTQEVAHVLGRPADDEQTGRALEQLAKAGYVEGRFAM